MLLEEIEKIVKHFGSELLYTTRTIHLQLWRKPNYKDDAPLGLLNGMGLKN